MIGAEEIGSQESGFGESIKLDEWEGYEEYDGL